MKIIILLISGYGLLLFVFPKGNNLHEILNIPVFWFRNFLVKKDNLITQKIKFGNLRNQYFLFYQPKKTKATKKHIILYFHGGVWIAGTPAMLKSNAQLFADQGYISVFRSYRKAPFASYTEMREDLTLCISQLEKVMKDNNLEDKKIIIGGMSAGANLAASLAFQQKELEQFEFYNNRITGMFLCGAPIDIAQMKWSIPLYLFAGARDSEKFKAANPINHFTSNKNFPILLIHGNKDGLVPYRNVIFFLKKAKQENSNTVKLHTIENGTHMDSASWGHTDNDLRTLVLEWLAMREDKA